MNNIQEILIEMIIEQSSPDLWSPLPGAYGEYFSIHGDDVAGVQANRIVVWQNGEIKYEGLSSTECGSYPIWNGSLIYWNDYWIDIETGHLHYIDIMKKGFFENLVIPDPTGKTNTGYRPITCAWSPDADFFIVSMEGFDKTGISHSRVILLDKKGTLRSILWEGNDFAPKAACINREYIILGTRDTTIFNLDGKLLNKLPGELIPQRIHFSENGATLFIQTYESIALWETGTWINIGLLKGPWLNATLSPDAGVIYAIDFGGNLSTAIVSDTIGPMKKIPVPAPLATIDAGTEYLVASFAHGDPVRRALKRDIMGSIIKNL